MPKEVWTTKLDGDVCVLRFTPDGSLVVGCTDPASPHTVAVNRLQAGDGSIDHLSTVTAAASVLSLDLSFDGTLLSTMIGIRPQIQVWRTATGQEVAARSFAAQRPGAPRWVAAESALGFWDPDAGKWFAWEPETRLETPISSPFPAGDSHLSYLGKGTQVWYPFSPGTVPRLVVTGGERREIPLGVAWSVGVDPSGKWAAVINPGADPSGSKGRWVRVIDLRTGKVVYRFPGPPRVQTASLALDRSRLALGCGDGRVQLLEMSEALAPGSPE